MRLLAFLGCLTVVLGCRPAFAADSRFYLVPSAGAVLFSGGSQTVVTPDSIQSGGALSTIVTGGTTRTTTSRSADRESLRLGYRFTPHVALELEAARVGRWSQMSAYQPNAAMPDGYSGHIGVYRSAELGVNAVATLPVGGRFALQAGLGCAGVRTSTKSTVQGGIAGGATIGGSTTDLQYSVELGATCRVAPSVALRAGVEAFFPQSHLAQPKPHMIGLSLGVVIDL